MSGNQGFMKYVPPAVGKDEEEKPGDSYEGNMEAGRREGHGKYTWSNGAIFEGQYSGNKKNGKGKLSLSDKSVFEGEFMMSCFCTVTPDDARPRRRVCLPMMSCVMIPVCRQFCRG